MNAPDPAVEEVLRLAERLGGIAEPGPQDHPRARGVGGTSVEPRIAVRLEGGGERELRAPPQAAGVLPRRQGGGVEPDDLRADPRPAAGLLEPGQAADGAPARPESLPGGRNVEPRRRDAS